MVLAADPDIIQTLGLALDVVGIVILFRYQIDFNRHITNEQIKFAWHLGSKSQTPDAKRKYAHYVRMTYSGMACILVGFVIQMIALWL